MASPRRGVAFRPFRLAVEQNPKETLQEGIWKMRFSSSEEKLAKYSGWPTRVRFQSFVAPVATPQRSRCVARKTTRLHKVLVSHSC